MEEEDDGKINICEQTVHEFHSFNFMFQGGYKDIGVIRYLFETIAGIREMSKVYPKPLSDAEALDELIDSALAYRVFITKSQEKV